MNCLIAGCVGPTENGVQVCRRHLDGRTAPPMKVTCECAAPDVEMLRAFGLTAAECRRCGSPIEGTLCGS